MGYVNKYKNDWYIFEFTPEQIEKLKKYHEAKNKRIQYNNFDKNYETRWVGTAGEYAFKKWAERHGYVTTWHNNKGIDELDFTLGTMLIDVKTVATNVFPRSDYNCLIDSRQMVKLRRSKVNTYVFSRFLLPKNEAIILGWLPKLEFEERAQLYGKGEILGFAVADHDTYLVNVKELRPLSEIFIYFRN